MAVDGITELAVQLLEAKVRIREAQDAYDAVLQKLEVELPGPAEGRVTAAINHPDFKTITLTRQVNRSVDTAAVEELRGELDVDHFFTTRYSLVLSAYRKAGDNMRALLSCAITSKPGKSQVEIKERP